MRSQVEGSLITRPHGTVVSLPEPAVRPMVRPQVRGKFLMAGEEKLYVRGITYGPFDSGSDGGWNPLQVWADLEAIAATGANAIRTYTVPPPWMLDEAAEHGLRVMVGLPWEQHVAFLDERRRARDIVRRVREGVRACAGHPAILGYAVGNEIPSPVVRWLGAHRVERFLQRLCDGARDEDPEAIVTYVNYPTTEYLELPFVDVLAFNVFLEDRRRLAAYLARLHVLAGDRPVLLGELGLDSRRNGEAAQARAVEDQVRTAFEGGSAGAFVFSWSDEWHRGGEAIEDWQFGLVTRERLPKPALAAAHRAFAEVPFGRGGEWPRISVVVCSLNGARTIGECMAALRRLDYPDYEVIVVDDGSTDATADIARAHGFPVISTQNMGLSSARNTGLQAATGEIVAYLDDDAYPDPDWLHYLAATFRSTWHVGVGGPNIAPSGDGPVAECVANAPGGPVHVLVSDSEAEHIPGCNMAFRAAALRAIGGFDIRFRVAGDDVDICWRLQDAGMTLGFSPAAVVWHHRRPSVRAFWRQQRGYGRAEALLEEKWPARYNTAGHVTWSGSVYGEPGRRRSRRVRVYQGTWGTAPFQAATRRPPGRIASLLAMPEWWLVVAALAVLGVLGTAWRPLIWFGALAGIAAAAPVVMAWRRAWRASYFGGTRRLLRWRLLTVLLHVLQPLARLWGRLLRGLTPWRGSHLAVGLPWPRTVWRWSERWRPSESCILELERALQEQGCIVARGGDYDRWDLQVTGGTLGAARLLVATEEHAQGRQLVRFRSWPVWSRSPLITSGVLFGAAVAAHGAGIAPAILGGSGLLVSGAVLRQTGAACRAISSAIPATIFAADTAAGSEPIVLKLHEAVER